ncbi:MAG: dihydroorotase [Gammaproteobacteria bacterium]
MKKITLMRPDDWHLHCRNGEMLKTVIAHTARQFARAIVMPNLKPPIISVEQALIYRNEILHALPAGSNFTPLMTLYLTDAMTEEEVRKTAESEFVHAIKLYPAGATTNSQDGLSDLKAAYSIFEAMEKYDVPLLIHAEVTGSDIDIFDREKVFIERCLIDIVDNFPEIRIVFEHATTTEAVQFVLAQSEKIAATITPQHLMYNRNAILAGGIKPHHYCMPIIKREIHRQSLLEAATSGNPKFFLGTDSAPHLRQQKESACGCAGCYTAHAAIELYAEIFEQADALDKLEGFASYHGPDFYRLPRNLDQITLEKTDWIVPDSYATCSGDIIPLKAGEICRWKLVD